MNPKSIFRNLPLLPFALCLLANPLSAATFGNFTYTDNGTSISITGYPPSVTGAVVIPATITGKPVTSIGASAFTYCTALTSVKIPASVTSIGDSAFYRCVSLTTENIPNSVTSVGGSAFYGCNSLVSVTIPNSVTSIGVGAFSDCTSLSSVTIGSGVISIGDNAFYNCASLPSVTIPYSVTKIGVGAFSECFSMVSIEVDLSNPNYSSLDGVLFNKKQTKIWQYPNAKSGTYSIPTSVTSIGDFAFHDCNSLISVTISNRVTTIGNGAFGSCVKLTSVTIPNNVFSIGNSAFAGCPALVSIEVASTNYSYSSLSGVLFNKEQTEIVAYPGGKGDAYSIPTSVTTIGDTAFLHCTSLSSVTIPNSVTSIGGGAFLSCTSLTNVTIPNSVTAIGFAAFEECTSLTSVMIGSGVTSIADYAFYSCTSLAKAIFLGNAPIISSFGVFDDTSPQFTVVYTEGSTGFSTPTWNGYPAVARPNAPDIAVQQPFGSGMVDGKAKRSFGSRVVGSTTAARTFTINNTGTQALTGLGITQDGANAGDFIVTAPVKTTLAPGETTTFTVKFKPTATGTRNGAIHIGSNDPDENPFDILLTGLGT